MSKTTFINLDRNFTKYRPDHTVSENYWLGDEQSSTSITWSSLIEKQLVVILAEAGSGKTKEVQAQVSAIKNKGDYAFFIRLEYLSGDIEYAFETPSEFKSFSEWLTSDKPAWIFLDSVDESRIINRNHFDLAIKKIGHKLGDASHRAHVFITGRGSEWNHVNDTKVITNNISIKKNVIVENDNEKGTKNKESNSDNKFVTPSIYKLNPLSHEQIRVFSTTKGITDADAFIHSIKKYNAEMFASRPLDLETLISYWEDNGRLAKRLDLLKHFIEENSKELRNTTSFGLPLTADKVDYACKILAASLILTHKSRILLPGPQQQDGVDSTKILSSWDNREISALFQRPIFDAEIFSSIRFHNRVIREYLTAVWFADLIGEEKSRREIETLLFKKQYGINVINPILRPVLPWLSLLDDRICKKTTILDPKIFIEGGDPTKLNIEDRINILRNLCSHLAQNNEYWDGEDTFSIIRFTDKKLSQTINSLLDEYQNAPTIEQLLLKFVLHGEIKDCLDKVLSICENNDSNEISRMLAVKAFNTISNQAEKRRFIKGIFEVNGPLKDYFIADIIDNFGFTDGILSPVQILTLIERRSIEDKLKYSPVKSTLAAYLEKASTDDIPIILAGMINLLNVKPLVEERHIDLSAKHRWLLPLAAQACDLILAQKDPALINDAIMWLISQCQISASYSDFSGNKHNLKENIQGWPDINQRLFWYEIDKQRKNLKSNNPDRRLTHWFEANTLHHFWGFSFSDFDASLEDIDKKEFIDDKQVALSLCWQLYKENNNEPSMLASIKKAIKDTPILEARLSAYLNPVKSETELSHDAEALKWKQRDALNKKRKAEEKKQLLKDLNRKENDIKTMSPDMDSELLNLVFSLLRSVQELDTGSHRYSHDNCEELVHEFGKKVTGSFIAGAVGFWRQSAANISAKSSRNHGHTQYTTMLGMTGIAMEAKLNASWTSTLSSEEAKLATIYALHEINGFPKWLPTLYRDFPNEVLSLFLGEIIWEFKDYKGDNPSHHVLSNITWHGDWIKQDIIPYLIDYLSKYNPKHINTSIESLEIILSKEAINSTDLCKIAETKIADRSNKQTHVLWLVTWMCLDSQPALKALKKYIRSYNRDAKKKFLMHFVGWLEGSATSRQRLNTVHRDYSKVGILRELIRLAHDYIRPEDDNKRLNRGVYSPDERDDAEAARDQLFNQLQQIPGKEAFDAIQEIAQYWSRKDVRWWFAQQAQLRAVTDAKNEPWTEQDVLSYIKDTEVEPQNQSDLFNLVQSRLLDFKYELENDDSSYADTLQKVSQEVEQRKFISNILRDKSKQKYTVAQEEELADKKRTDIRIHHPHVQSPVPIELKIADKWTGNKLFERLENQLCGDYMRELSANHGIYLLMYRGEDRKSWLPDGYKTLKFDALVDALQKFVDDKIESISSIHKIKVIGIDLTFRNKSRY